MTDTNIFDEAIPQKGEFKKFEKIGDEVQGTYIDVREGVDGYGNQQRIYVLKDKEGKIWNVAFKKTNTIILEKMSTVTLGQIVGFRFEESRPSKKIEGKNAKIIRVYEDKKIVDKEWIETRKKIEERFGGSEPFSSTKATEFSTTTAPETATTVTAAVPVANTTSSESTQIEAIRNLALTNGLTDESMSVEEQEAKISAFTLLPITKENLTQVIIKLTSYKK